jgi:hypothetical protein
MKIKDFINHLNKECITVKYTCPNECGETFNYKDSMNHYLQCPKMAHICQFCKMNITEANKDHFKDCLYDCVKYFRSLVPSGSSIQR